MTDFSKLLNPEQCDAATAGEGPILVLAAAGTGKTRTLVHRVAYLLEQGVEPSQILLLTFTNRAAKEMTDRAEKLVGADAMRIWSGTFHSICARFLRHWGSAIGINPSFKIIDEEDQKKIITEAIKQSVADPKNFVKKDIVLKMISEAANEEKPVGFIAARWQTKAAGFTPAEIEKVAQYYIEKKKSMSVMDFDDLLINGLKLLKESASVRDIVQKKFLHVLVDEYQDTNTLQAEFSDIIAQRNRNIMAVGDDFQCIYTWRGAKIENIIRFPDRWSGCRIIKLERNYRSVPAILDIANSVMHDAPKQFEKNLKPTRYANDIRPRTYSVRDSKSQAAEITSILNEMRQKGFKWSDMAILYRSHYHSIDIEKNIIASGIPYRLTSGVGFYEQQHIKDVLSYLRLIVDPTDELSFKRFITLFPGIGEAGAQKIWTKVGRAFSPTEPFSRMALSENLPAKAKAVWTPLEGAMSRAGQRLVNGEHSMIVLDFIQSFYSEYISREWEGSEADDRLAGVKELANDIASDKKNLSEYLADIALMTNLDLKKNNATSDSITLSTIHQAKGMEWPVVIVPWLSEGMFPNPKAIEENRTDEERRLFYVVVTRAKDSLCLISPSMRANPEGGEFPVDKSIFIKEIPSSLVDARKVYSDGFNYNPYMGRSSYGGYGGGGYGGGGYGGGGYGNRYGNRYGGGYGRNSGGQYKTTWRR
jgi:DNA helicase-2/ATP-dependent DNA helicase PcrA